MSLITVLHYVAFTLVIKTIKCVSFTQQLFYVYFYKHSSFYHSRANVKDLKVDVIVNFPKLEIKGNYDLVIKLFGQNLDNRGDGVIKLDNARARVAMKGSRYTKEGKEYIKFDRFRLKVQPGTIRHLKLSNLFQNDKNLEEAANAFINANSDFLLQNVYPTVEKDLAELLTNIANELAKNATYDELFPL